jgi:4-diphosphocytidyl-2-C-methyl-D-erythritol kinase
MADGYHNLRMVMQTVSLSDEITIECVQGEGVSVKAGLPYLPSDERNIAAKAVLAYFKHTGITGYRINIGIKKAIPVCAGLGGGSTDGACVLRMLDEMFMTNLGLHTLEELGGTIGSDVPYCVGGGTRLVEGRGEILTDLPQMPQSFIVIVKPSFSCSTPELFKRVKCEKIRSRPDTDGIIKALGEGDLHGIARRMYNVFEDVLPRGERDVADIKYTMLDHGALGAVMTGSGPAVFGVFDKKTNAENAYEHLKGCYRDCFMAVTV